MYLMKAEEEEKLQTASAKNESSAIKKSFDAIYGYPRSVDLVHENKRVSL